MKKLLLALLIFLLASCVTTRTVEVPVEVEKIKTEYITVVKYDSIYVRDSVDRYSINDTVYIYKYKELLKYKYLNDTIIRQDTIQIPVTMTVETVKEVNKLKGYQQFFIYLGVIVFILIILYIIYRVARRVIFKV